MDYENVKEWIPGMESYIPGETREGFIKLASNENNYGPSPLVVETLEKFSGSVNKYPYRGKELREKIADYLGLSAENIILGNGSDELIDMILKVFNGPTMSFNPTFAEYRLCTLALGEKYLEVNLDQEFQFPLDEFIQKAKEANIIFLCNPNSPTGTTMEEDQIKEILSLDKLTVVDEAYGEFYGESSLSLLEEYDNLVVLRTFAKAFALAGLRIGYAISNPEIISLLNKVRLPFNINSMAHVAALAALDSVEYMQETVEKIKKDREILFQKLGEKFKVFPSQANFIFVDVAPRTADEIFQELLKEKIIVRKFGKLPGFPGDYVRISVGTSEENQKLIQALDKC